jgi:hypothetical protein
MLFYSIFKLVIVGDFFELFVLCEVIKLLFKYLL